MRYRRYSIGDDLKDSRKQRARKSAIYALATILGAGLGYWFNGAGAALAFGVGTLLALYLVLNE